MLYELSLFTSGSTYRAILKDVSVENGCVHGTMVGVEGATANVYKERAFVAHKPCDFFAGGSFTLIEYKGTLKNS